MEEWRQIPDFPLKALMTDEEVAQVRLLMERKEVSLYRLARLVGCGESTLRNIRNGLVRRVI